MCGSMVDIQSPTADALSSFDDEAGGSPADREAGH